MDRLDRAIELITNPAPDSKLAAAKEFGINPALLIEDLALAPTERLQRLCAPETFYEALRKAEQRNRMR